MLLKVFREDKLGKTGWIYFYYLSSLTMLLCQLRAAHAFRSRKPYLDIDLCEDRSLETRRGVSRRNLFSSKYGNR